MIAQSAQQAISADQGRRAGTDPCRVVLSGSYRRDLGGLARVHDQLVRAGCEILSPAAIEFATEVDGFAFALGEIGLEPEQIEERHLDCLRAADFVWLHAFQGYVGSSASLEVGYAHALGVPVFASTEPTEKAVAAFVRLVASPQEAVTMLSESPVNDPGRPLKALQDYYSVVAARRGYDNESPQDTMLLLTEELGELARAVRKHVGLVRDGGYGTGDVGDEIADVQLYLVHLANVLGTDLGTSVTGKERTNDSRHRAKLIGEAAPKS